MASDTDTTQAKFQNGVEAQVGEWVATVQSVPLTNREAHSPSRSPFQMPGLSLSLHLAAGCSRPWPCTPAHFSPFLLLLYGPSSRWDRGLGSDAPPAGSEI